VFETDQFIDTEGVAQLAVVSPRTVQNWIAQKKIPVVRLSKRCVRFNRADVVRALNKFTVKEVA